MIDLHPSDDTLLRFTSGDLVAAPALVVATHLSYCPKCCRTQRQFEQLGGVALESVQPVDITGDVAALLANPAAVSARSEPEASLALDNRSSNRTSNRSSRKSPPVPEGMKWPTPLSFYDISPWRFLGPGIQWAKVTIPEDRKAKVLLLRAKCGTALPLHTHTGTEYTTILHGSFDDRGQRIQTGDLTECGEHDRHQPVVDSHDDCVCVLAVEGRLVMSGWLAQLAQRLVGL